MPDILTCQELAPADMYHRVFVGHHEGATVLEDLVARFHDRNIYVAGGLEGSRETERRAAQKEVVGFILRRIGMVHQTEEN